VVLVSAMLVLPAAAAFLLCVRLGPMLALAAGIGGACGLGGALASYLGGQLPTGPLMVLCASAAVLLAWLFSPQSGLLARMWRQARLSRRIREENILRALYLELESKAADWEGAAAISEIAQRLHQPTRETAPHIRKLKKAGLATGQGPSAIRLTPKGLARARDIVRRHRLWELYLATAANFPPDHVHEDAEKIEHLLGEETLRRLDQRLPEALRDPHGKAIPGPRTHPPPRP
ncbi:MAG: metal ABC transporter permease, partial [Terrimicrobiaceae bacterium]|nr:metal ABC transporter permease [Terrimicrobiaceae bacterium]